MTQLAAPIATATRRDVRTAVAVEESWHHGHVVVVTGHGEVVGSLGDPSLVTFIRSTAKPFQASACLELLDLAGGPPSPAEIAVSWASHRAEPGHLAAVERLLARSGTEVEQLTCPEAVSDLDPAAPPSRARHNCSGKHALFALAGATQGTPRERLLDPTGPFQRVVLGIVAEALGPAIAIGVDGCGAPAVAVPLERLAHGFAALADDDRWARVRRAGLTHPDLIGGSGRLETALLGAGVVAKPGAEGVFAAGWVAPDGTARGLAVKAADGAARAAAAVTVTLLADLGVVPTDVWVPEPILGGGAPAGEVVAAPTVRELARRLEKRAG